MDIVIENKKWTVIKEYPKKRREKDLILCVDEYGVRECFQRFEVEGTQDWSQKRRLSNLTEEDKELIEREILNRTERRKIYEMLNNKSFQAVQNYIAKVRKKHGIKAHENAQKRVILQYDAEMNLIGRYYSFAEAAGNSFVEPEGISKCCRGLQSRAGMYYWKFEEDSK